MPKLKFKSNKAPAEVSVPDITLEDALRESKKRPGWMAMYQGEDDLFVIVDGIKIARRGYPDTPQAGTWVSLEPGYTVIDGADLGGDERGMMVIRDAVRIH